MYEERDPEPHRVSLCEIISHCLFLCINYPLALFCCRTNISGGQQQLLMVIDGGKEVVVVGLKG